jgi:hypothetical protein
MGLRGSSFWLQLGDQYRVVKSELLHPLSTAGVGLAALSSDEAEVNKLGIFPTI